MSDKIKKIISLVLAAILSLLCVSSFSEELAAGSSPAPVIRVLLKRLGISDRVDLYFDGDYSAVSLSAEAHFPAGSEVIVQTRGENLILFYKGMSVNFGKSLTFSQHSGQGMCFVKNGNYYPGSLKLSVQNGMISAVHTLSVEDYLLGVVPYEMSDQFPLEALKAQAVCARTYALAHMNANANYDVTDTTNDQVFRGINASQARAKKAVEETAGVVGGYNGELATCFYGASNGGQTELPQNVWGGNDPWKYYSVNDDKYDLENPESVVRRAKIFKNGDISNAEFKECIFQALSEKIRKNGFAQVPEAFRINSVSSVSVGTPKFSEPNRLYTEITMKFSWSGKKYVEAANTSVLELQDENQAEPATVMLSDFMPGGTDETVTLPLFPSVVRSLNLSINYSDNEMLTVVENNDSFVIESRRYGHGVGMSQRGAQWMAEKYGMKFYEILAFYYPGMSLMRAPFGAQQLSTAAPYLAESPSPAASPTPRPTVMPLTKVPADGQWVASVENVDDNSTLNLRESPDMASGIIMRLQKHQRLLVVEEMEDGEWAKVETDSASGYVMIKYLTAAE